MFAKNLAMLQITVLLILGLVWLLASGPLKPVVHTIWSTLTGVAGWLDGSGSGGRVGGLFGTGVRM